MSKGELKRVAIMHEEISTEDSGLPTKVIRNECKIKHWKERWIKEIDEKLRSRSIVIKDRKEIETVTTMSSFLMENAIGNVRIKKESVKLMQKINMVRKHKGEIFLHESLGEKGK